MRREDRASEACRRLERLESDRGVGARLDAEDRAFWADHLAACESCRASVAAQALLRHTDDEGPAEPLDELSRRRLVNDVVSRAAAAGPLSAEEPQRTAAGRPRWPWAAAAAAVLVVGLGLVGVLRYTGRGDAARKPSPAVQLVMRSGQVTVEGEPVRAALPVGKTLSVRKGRAVVALPDGALVLLGERSAARVVRLSAEDTTVHLEQGWLLASVPPKHQRRRFVVTTRAGRVAVTGTVFTVRVTASSVAVEVLRGRVKLLEPRRPLRQVERGHWALLGSGDRRVRAVAPAALKRARLRLAALALVGVDVVAKLELRSQPSGAEVAVDGVVLGRTPMMARLRVGHRRLEVKGEGRTPVREQLALRQGDRVHRDYDLSAQPVAERRPAPASTPPEPKTPGPGAKGGGVAPPKNGSALPAKRQPTRVRRSAKDLLRQARKRRAARDWRGAATSYGSLLARFPRSSAAGAARVALGLLKLDQLGDARGALRLFETYLRSTRRGVLAQEAAYGRIRALRRLGRKSAEKRALQRFLTAYPGAFQSRLVQARLKALGVTPGGAK